MRPRPLFHLALIAALALVLASSALADDWRRTFDIPGHASLRVETDDGFVTVRPWDKPQIDIHVTTNGWHIGSHATVDAQQAGSDVFLSVKVRRTIGFYIGGSRWIHIDVMVPAKSDLDVHTGDGSVDAEAIEGKLRLWTADGRLDARRLRGDLNLHSGDGGITASDLDGRLIASSGDGRINVGGRFDDLDLSSGDGSITARAESGSTHDTGWSLHTGDGGVLLRIPPGLKADLDVTTGDGSIHVDLPVQVSGTWKPTRSLHGTLNGGGPPLRLHSGDGSIRIEEI